MEIKKIRNLAAMLEEYGLEELSLQEGEDKVSLRRPAAPAVTFAQEAPILATPQVSNISNAPAKESNVSTAATATSVEQETGHEGVAITSPMVGMFYAAAAPNEPPFVEVGQKVAVGDVLCIIEAMKLMNEIVAEQEGIITHCHQVNGQLVEFGQPLFQIKEA